VRDEPQRPVAAPRRLRLPLGFTMLLFTPPYGFPKLSSSAPRSSMKSG
jgi:hypothetical protein